MDRWRFGGFAIIKRRKRDNSRVKAALLPEEILDNIFHLLLTRARFGSWIQVETGKYPPHTGYKHAALKDLASVSLVCRSWCPRATAALYTDVAFSSAHQFVRFADTLVARPHIARFVRLVKLPPTTMRISSLEPVQLYERVPWPKNTTTRWLDVRAAVNRILVQCINIEDVFVCGGQPQFEDIASLLRLSESLVRFTCCTMYLPPPRHYEVDIASATQQLRHLQMLTLGGRVVKTTPAMHTLPALHTLRLHSCLINHDWLPVLLSHLPNLRVLDWNGSAFCGYPGLGEATLPDMLRTQKQNLVSCTVIDGTGTRFLHLRITLSGMDRFTSLRSLSIVDTMLRDFVIPPPCLVELTIVTASSLRRPNSPEPSSLKFILNMARWLRSRIPHWRECLSPSLREIQLWDRAGGASTMRNWAMAAFLLKGFLGARDIDFFLNLKLTDDLVKSFREKFDRRELSRWHRWKNILHVGWV